MPAVCISLFALTAVQHSPQKQHSSQVHLFRTHLPLNPHHCLLEILSAQALGTIVVPVPTSMVKPAAPQIAYVRKRLGSCTHLCLARRSGQARAHKSLPNSCVRPPHQIGGQGQAQPRPRWRLDDLWTDRAASAVITSLNVRLYQSA
jgi:hypothetical protein